MASTASRKRTRSRAAPSRRRVADLTTDELREMLEQLIERKLVEFGGLPSHSTEKSVTAEMRLAAAAVAGRFRSGVSNISEDHDRFLAASYLE
jgi:hypothetical protein